MSSAVLDRILAIPDYDPDYRQMGISGRFHDALLERGGLRKDGTKAKASVLKKDFSKSKEKAIIKGDRALESTARIESAKPTTEVKESKNKIDFVNPSVLRSRLEKGERAYSYGDFNVDSWGKKGNAIADRHFKQLESLKSKFKSKSDTSSIDDNIKYHKKVFDNYKLQMAAKEPVSRHEYIASLNRLANSVAQSVEDKATRIISSRSKSFTGKMKASRSKRAMTSAEAAISTSTPYRAKESQGQGNLFNQPKSATAAIAPDTARKVKDAIQGKPSKRVKTGTIPIRSKESWMISKDQYISENVRPKTRFNYGYDEDIAKEDHKNFVIEALKAGRRVSDKVLKDYPDLKRSGIKKRKAKTLPKEEMLRRRQNLYNKLVD